jgi:hypothetical protein
VYEGAGPAIDETETETEAETETETETEIEIETGIPERSKGATIPEA